MPALFMLFFFFFFNTTSITDIYTLSLHDALPIYKYKILTQENELTIESLKQNINANNESNNNDSIALEKANDEDRKSTRLNSSHMSISYAVFCLKKKKKNKVLNTH